MKHTILQRGLAGLAALVLLTGCASLGGKSPEQKVAAAVEAWAEAVRAKDYDGIMAVYSEQFKSQDGQGKAQVGQFMKRMIDQGELNSAQVRTDQMTVTAKEDGNYRAYPVEITVRAGGATLDMTFAKDEDGAFRMIAMGIDTY